MKPDSDGDGLDDATERSRDTRALRADTDGDGLTDKEEEVARTNPLKADRDGDTIPDGDEVYSLYLNPNVPDEFLVSSAEWEVQYYKGFKLGGDCVDTSDSGDLRRCLGTLPFRLGQAAALVAHPVASVIESIQAKADFVLGFTGAVADQVVCDQIRVAVVANRLTGCDFDEVPSF